MLLPHIELPPRVPIALSEMYATPEYRIKTGEYDLVTWSGNLKRSCLECDALGMETPKGQIYTRSMKERGIRMYVCSAHRRMWRERDWLDGTEASWYDHVFVERLINNYRYQRTAPVTRKPTECERLIIVIWMKSNGYRGIDMLRVMGEDEHNWKIYMRYNAWSELVKQG